MTFGWSLNEHGVTTAFALYMTEGLIGLTTHESHEFAKNKVALLNTHDNITIDVDNLCTLLDNVTSRYLLSFATKKKLVIVSNIPANQAVALAIKEGQ